MQSNLLSRRSFLGHSALVATAIGGSLPTRCNAADTSTQSHMKLGLVTYLWGEQMDLPTLLDACSKSGIRGVELRTEHRHRVEPSLSGMQRDEVKKQFGDSGIELVGYGSNCEFHANDPVVVQKNIEQTKEYIRLMHDCGGTGVKVKPNAFVKGVPQEKTIEQIGNALNEVAEYGNNYGQQIRVEVHGTGTSELTVIRDIFKVATHPNATICWNSNPEDLHGAGLEANFEMVKKRFGNTCHVRELDDANYPYAKLLSLFKAIDYAGWILLECRSKQDNKIVAMNQQRQLFEQMLAG